MYKWSWEFVIQTAKNHGFTQKALARELKVNQNTVYGWITRNSTPPADTACYIARILGTTVESLLKQEEEDSTVINLRPGMGRFLALIEKVPKDQWDYLYFSMLGSVNTINRSLVDKKNEVEY